MKLKKIILQFSAYMICAVMLSLSLTASSYGQRSYLFENISIAEGLSNSEVHSIFQDSNGFLWISTADGLNRYDGNSMKVYKNDPNISTTLPNNNCWAIAEDSKGFLWVGVSGNAITRFDPKNETFIRYLIDTGGNTGLSEFHYALFDSKGRLWFGTTNHGIQKFNNSQNQFEQVPLDSTNNNAQWGQIFDITELQNGNILVADYSSGIKIYNEKRNLFLPYYLRTNYSPKGINIIYEDASGNIWFGGLQLIKYSPSFYTTEEYALIDNLGFGDDIEGIVQDDQDFLWIGVYRLGLFRIDPKTKSIRKFNYTNENSSTKGQEIIWKVYKDRYGVIWIGHIGIGLSKFDPLREPFNYSKFRTDEVGGTSSNYTTIIAGTHQSKEVTVGTSSKGLFSYNLVSKNSINIKTKFDPTTFLDGSINIQSLAVDDRETKWFTYNNLGLHKIDKNNILSLIKSPNRNKVNDSRTNSMKIDLSGNIWMASGVGYEYYNPETGKFALIPTIMNKKMSISLRNKIVKIPQSREPVASILKVGEASNIEKKFSLNENQKVLIICVGEGRMNQGNEGVFDKGSILSDDGNLIWAMDDLSKTFNDGGGFKNRIAVKCIDLKKGGYKITFATDVGHSYGTWNVPSPIDSAWYGIQVLSINESEYNSIKELNETEINSDKYLPLEVGTFIEFSKKLYNVLWLGSVANSFFKYDLSTGNFKQYNFNQKNKFSPNNNIASIFEDRLGNVWVATANSLLRFDKDTEEIDKYDQTNGLPSNQINSLIEDLQGNLWISTSGGLSKLNKNAPKEKWNFVNFDARDGLQSVSASKASWISKDGEIVLGSNDGIISFYPGKINEVKPDIVIEDIKVSDISVKSDSSVVKLEKSLMEIDEIDLSHSQNNLSFEFASIHFSRPAKNKLEYKLEGFNNHWKSTDRNFSSYTNLEPGEYTFWVKGSNGDGIWNDEGKSIRIIISPPWWQTTMAYVLYILLFAGIIFGVDRVQKKRILSKERNAAAIKEANLRAQLAESENDRKTQELEEARQLQLSMLPKELPSLPHLDIAVYMQTATEVGGDYYDFHVALDGTLTVVVGDATGHGMKAGTMVTTAKSLFRSFGPNPDILLSFQEFTRCIKEMNLGKLSMCMTMLKIKDNKMQLSTAGMPPSFIFRKDTRVVEEHLFKAMPLGTMDKFPYEIIDKTLRPGDTILLLSDGLPELKNSQDKMYGYQRIRSGFEDIGEKSPEEIVLYLKNEGSAWVNNANPDDDVTFVVIKVK